MPWDERSTSCDDFSTSCDDGSTSCHDSSTSRDDPERYARKRKRPSPGVVREVPTVILSGQARGTPVMTGSGEERGAFSRPRRGPADARRGPRRLRLHARRRARAPATCGTWGSRPMSSAAWPSTPPPLTPLADGPRAWPAGLGGSARPAAFTMTGGDDAPGTRRRRDGERASTRCRTLRNALRTLRGAGKFSVHRKRAWLLGPQ